MRIGRHWITLAAALALAATRASAEAPCPHPYFPLEEGLTLTYRSGGAEVRVTFSDVRREGAGLRGQLHMQHEGKSGATEARCTPEGILTTGGLEGAALSMSGMTVNVLEARGIAMLPAAQMVEGATWSNTLSIELRPPEKVKIPFGPVRTTFKKEAIVEGREKIEIAGKTWDALRVKNRVTAMGGSDGDRTLESTMWLAPGVGILKIQTGETVDLELLDVTRPTKKQRPKSARPNKPANSHPGK
jgi:hypothetical protein